MATQDYFKKPEETIEQYNARISSLGGQVNTQTTPDITSQVNAALGGQFFDPISGKQLQQSPAQIANPVAPPTTTGGSPTLPTPTAIPTNENYYVSASAELANTRKMLEDSYNKQIEEYQRQAKESQDKIDKYTSLQEEGVLTNIQTLSKPFRETLESSQRESLFVNENFQANQKLTNELDSLLTQGNNLIQGIKASSGPASIMNARVAQTISDVNARAGVIEAVMSARNGQIGQAYRMIDRSVEAMNADRKDQIDYYKTLFNFYEGQKDTEGKKLLAADKNQQDFIKSKIGLLESDMKTSETNVENIKKAMTDPDTALAYAHSGVTLNDTPAQINKKLSEYAYAKEVSTTSNEMAKSGYTYLSPGQSAPAGTNVVTVTDSKGVTKNYFKAPTSDSTKSSGYAQAEKFITDNPDATYEELRNTILQKTNLTVTEADALLASKGKSPTKKGDDPLVEIKTSIEKAQKLGFTRDQTEQSLKDTNNLPEIPEPIMKILDEIYGPEEKSEAVWYDPRTWF